MSWSEQEKNLKNKLLNYAEEVNNEALWAVLSNRQKPNRKMNFLPLLIAALTGMLSTSMVGWHIIHDKNEKIINLSEALYKVNLNYANCTKNNIKPNKEITNIESPALASTLIEKDIIKNKKAQTKIQKAKFNDVNNSKINVNVNTIDKSDSKSETTTANKHESLVIRNQIEPILPIDNVKCNLNAGLSPNVLFFPPVKTKKINSNTLYISGHTGIPFTFDQPITNEQKIKKMFTPVLANKLSFGIKKRIIEKLDLSGELSYSVLTSKLNYTTTTVDQIYLTDTSLVTIDEFGNNLYAIDQVAATKITDRKGEAYNVSKAIALNLSLSYQVMGKLNARIGFGYNVWESNRGLQYETLNKFTNDDNIIKYKTNYTVGFEYNIYKALHLDVMCIYSRSNYINSNYIYQRSSYTPLIGINYWIK